jgi:polyhydroxybutyrate depolymerase
MPLVVSFHGRGSTAAADENVTGLSHVADRRGFIAVYPQGVIAPNGSAGWNTGRSQDPQVDDLLFVGDLLTQLQRTLCVDSRRIYAMGFSNGGGLTAVLACTYSTRFSAFASVAGDYTARSAGCHPARPIPIVEIHGTADPVNPYEGSERLKYLAVNAWLSSWVVRDGCMRSPRITTIATGIIAQKWSGCRDGVAIVHYQLRDVGHVWPSTFIRGGASAAFGHPPFDATTAIWSFFSQQVLPTTDATYNGSNGY